MKIPIIIKMSLFFLCNSEYEVYESFQDTYKNYKSILLLIMGIIKFGTLLKDDILRVCRKFCLIDKYKS